MISLIKYTVNEFKVQKSKNDHTESIEKEMLNFSLKAEKQLKPKAHSS